MALIEAKKKAIHSWFKPQNIRDVHSFLGFANYYRRFIKNLVGMTCPLMDLTKKGVPPQWGSYQRQAFQQLKDAVCTMPVLLFPDLMLQYAMVIDASRIATGGILMQDQGTGLQPLAFLNGHLKPTE